MINEAHRFLDAWDARVLPLERSVRAVAPLLPTRVALAPKEYGRPFTLLAFDGGGDGRNLILAEAQDITPTALMRRDFAMGARVRAVSVHVTVIPPLGRMPMRGAFRLAAAGPKHRAYFDTFLSGDQMLCLATTGAAARASMSGWAVEISRDGDGLSLLMPCEKDQCRRIAAMRDRSMSNRRAVVTEIAACMVDRGGNSHFRSRHLRGDERPFTAHGLTISILPPSDIPSTKRCPRSGDVFAAV